MSLISEVRRLLAHMDWADRLILTGLETRPEVPAQVLREFGHILGADEVWLARLERRAARVVIWPDLSLSEAARFLRTVHTAYASYLAGLGESGLGEVVPYTNSAGQAFQTPVKDILMHVAMHAQYHRGKINVHLRQAGQTPIPTDYISFVRGVPAATTA